MHKNEKGEKNILIKSNPKKNREEQGKKSQELLKATGNSKSRKEKHKQLNKAMNWLHFDKTKKNSEQEKRKWREENEKKEKCFQKKERRNVLNYRNVRLE